IATGLEARYPGRVALVGLAPLADPALLPSFVANALGLHEAGEARLDAEGVSDDPRGPAPPPAERVAARGAPDAQSLLQALTERLSQQPTLLMLDNCEHMIEAAAALAHTLLEACP